MGIPLKVELFPNNNPVDSHCLTELHSLLSHNAHFDKSIGFPCFAFATFRF